MSFNIGKGKAIYDLIGNKLLQLQTPLFLPNREERSLVGSIFASVLFFYETINEGAGEYNS